MKIKIFSLIAFLIASASYPYLSSGNDTEFFGTISGKTGGLIIIEMEQTPLLSSGTPIDLYKYFQKTIFGMNTTGWLHIAEANVISINGKNVSLKIIKKMSEMVVNNKKVDHFIKGNRVKLVPKKSTH